MKRKQFLKHIAAATGIMTLVSFDKIGEFLDEQDNTMPVLFVGHGSPMNAIEDNQFSQRWAALGREIVTPKAILCISAHWLSKGTFVTAMEHPQTIHDFGGFPQALFDVQYPALGDPKLASDLNQLVKKTQVGLNHDWGLDHGTWSIAKNMYPNANIPVLQMSIDYGQSMQYHYDLAKELSSLRKKGVLIIGSGNMIHNLGLVAWNKLNQDNYGFDWAIELNEKLKEKILNKNHADLINYSSLGAAATLAIPSPDHYIPMLYALGLQDSKDSVEFFNDKLVGGSLNMTSFSLSHKVLNSSVPSVNPIDSTQVDSANLQ
ncbi:MAG: 4,5-DOPA dioxygenase extradiol [Bacteroidia bacterium]|nr:4,5-DOPA dioxygenase extradiol [Bacteroidia bacterium]